MYGYLDGMALMDLLAKTTCATGHRRSVSAGQCQGKSAGLRSLSVVPGNFAESDVEYGEQLLKLRDQISDDLKQLVLDHQRTNKYSEKQSKKRLQVSRE